MLKSRNNYLKSRVSLQRFSKSQGVRRRSYEFAKKSTGQKKHIFQDSTRPTFLDACDFQLRKTSKQTKHYYFYRQNGRDERKIEKNWEYRFKVQSQPAVAFCVGVLGARKFSKGIWRALITSKKLCPIC